MNKRRLGDSPIKSDYDYAISSKTLCLLSWELCRLIRKVAPHGMVSLMGIVVVPFALVSHNIGPAPPKTTNETNLRTEDKKPKINTTHGCTTHITHAWALNAELHSRLCVSVVNRTFGFDLFARTRFYIPLFVDG